MDLLDTVAGILEGLGAEKPWMTAAGLSRTIRRRSGDDVPAADIEAMLIEHTQTPGRRIRHSHYPSKRTLDVLWGHVCVVDERRSLAELDRIDDPRFDPCDVDEDAPWFFVSHNFRDFRDALELRRLLGGAGCGAWLFEAEIPQGGQIATHVQDAIRECTHFLSYVTRRSLGSLWVQKEIEVARDGGRTDTLVLVDARDRALLALFEAWTGESPVVTDAARAYAAEAAAELGFEPHSPWAQRCEAFMESLHEYVGDTNRLLCHPPPADTRWHGRLELTPLADFLEERFRRS